MSIPRYPPNRLCDVLSLWLGVCYHQSLTFGRLAPGCHCTGAYEKSGAKLHIFYEKRERMRQKLTNTKHFLSHAKTRESQTKNISNRKTHSQAST